VSRVATTREALHEAAIYERGEPVNLRATKVPPRPKQISAREIRRAWMVSSLRAALRGRRAPCSQLRTALALTEKLQSPPRGLKTAPQRTTRAPSLSGSEARNLCSIWLVLESPLSICERGLLGAQFQTLLGIRRSRLQIHSSRLRPTHKTRHQRRRHPQPRNPQRIPTM